MPSDDALKTLRKAVGQTLEMAEAETKLTDETQQLLAQLILTKRGDGETVIDIGALQRMRAAENQWATKEKNDQDRLINPTRLPSMMYGLQGLQSSQYLSYVQRPLERDGSNGPFLEANSHRLVAQYQAKDLAEERTKIFGHYQRYIAKLLLNAVFAKQKGISDQAELDKLIQETPPQQQFEAAAQELGISTGEVMSRLFKYAVALTTVERIKLKVQKIKKAQPAFEKKLKTFASSDAGLASKNKIKELFVSFHEDIKVLTQAFVALNHQLDNIHEKMAGDVFEQSYSDLHASAARLDAPATLWTIIIQEANAPAIGGIADKVKGMHKVLKG